MVIVLSDFNLGPVVESRLNNIQVDNRNPQDIPGQPRWQCPVSLAIVALLCLCQERSHLLSPQIKT